MKKMLKLSMMVLLCLTGIISCFFVNSAMSQETYKEIATLELNKWIASDNKPLLAFAVSPLEFASEHIPGSTCIPYELVKNYYNMPEKLSAPIVFYCHGPG